MIAHDPVIENLASESVPKRSQLIERSAESEIYVTFTPRGEIVVEKQVNSDELFYREHRALSVLHHPYIVNYIGRIPERTLLLEYCNEGNLLDMLNVNASKIERSTRYRWIAQLSGALRCVHTHNLLHGDLKPQNILVHDGELRLADFGMSMPINGDRRFMNGTIGYEAPEERLSGIYDVSSEIFSLGLVFYNILTGKHLICAGEKQIDEFYANVLLGVRNGLRSVPREFRQLLVQMLDPVPSERPNLMRVCSNVFGLINELV